MATIARKKTHRSQGKPIREVVEEKGKGKEKEK